eukprot:TRINITY_DN7803_c0_g1_i2.p1 TRINITY_DN7803_c0_g1~~TRINITY_DN7803_c0_g1_i2.p1  ORF type:complete len:550 (+),score=130.96 TRINITY_DN7803_c0_g1_i2:42-1652(+)
MWKVAATLLLAGVSSAATADPSVVSIWVSNRLITKHVAGVVDRSASGYGAFEDTLNSTGWGVLDVATGTGAVGDMGFAVGAAEGYLTAGRIWEHYLNMRLVHYGNLNSSEIKQVEQWMTQQDTWMRQQITSNPTDNFWVQLGNIVNQFDGLIAGYNLASQTGTASVPALDKSAFSMLNGDGDLFQIIPAVIPRLRTDYSRMSNSDADQSLLRAGKCSSIIKITGNFSELFMGHSSWYEYTATNRIFKHYTFDFPQVAAKKVSFSSYPGYLESLDDFYMMSSGLGMVQTSINFANTSFYNLVTPQSLLAWQRVRTAHVVSTTGDEWHQAMATSHSGTYCNQYMVINFNLFEAGKPLKPGTLWVVEEIPGQIPGKDMTEILSYGYWPSYNVPYFPEVYESSGLKALALRGVPSAAYQTAPRALLFRRDADTVKSLDTYGDILRSNAYTTDPYSEGNPCHAICCRGDLGNGGSPFGCYDTKITSSAIFSSMTAKAINGPTRGTTGNLPPFAWNAFPTSQHIGLPPKYDFDWVTMVPKNL